MNFLATLAIHVAPFSLREGIIVVVVLAVCGFLLWLLFDNVPMTKPFPAVIMFVVFVMVLWWLLTRFGLL
jgi:hypothetical protein